MELNKSTLSNIGSSILNGAADLLTNSDFISRTIGMTSSYDDIMFIVQALGREPISLLGKDYAFIFDHVRRNYQQGYSIPNMIHPECPKFTFYKEIPTVRFADPYQDPMSYFGNWIPNMKFENTAVHIDGGSTSIHYSESDDESTNNRKIGDVSEGSGTYTNTVKSFGPEVSTCDLIRKTNDNFNHGKYRTLVARFHTNHEDSKDKDNPTQTAITRKYGMSHGRNLLKRQPDKPNGYDNPYCRVWTYHHQYNKIKDLIRPFELSDSAQGLEDQEGGGNPVSFRTTGNTDSLFGGSKALDVYGVLNYNNGFVNIAPTAKIKDYFDDKQDTDNSISIKKCMFSIENLAWRDEKSYNKEYSEFGLSAEQRGPLGGRIMWFPPYDLNFNESVTVDWNGNKFIGRGEQIYTYTNTERTGSLSFTLLIDHPSIIDYWVGRDVTEGDANRGGVDNIGNEENQILRFFAGCEILTAKQQTALIGKVEPKEEEEEKDKIDEVQEPENAEPVAKTIEAILYFPNNYSGNKDTIDPILYLLNGAGANKYVDKERNNISSDIPTYDNKKAIIDNGLGDTYEGGYEMSEHYEGDKVYGISYTTENLPSGSSYSAIATRKMTKTDGEAEYLSTPDLKFFTVRYGDSEQDKYILSKLVGSKVSSLENKDFFKGRFYYRIDSIYSNQSYPKNMDSYLDTKSYGLNHDGYTHVRENSNTLREFGLKADSDTYRLVSFSDLFLALEGDKGIISKGKNYDFLKGIFEDKERFKITNISFVGHASKQGRVDSNDALSKNRGETLKKWASKHFDSSVLGDVTTHVQTKKPKIDSGGNSGKEVKVWRSASIVIEYEESEDSNAVNTKAAQGIDKVEVPNKETSNMYTRLFGNVLKMSTETDPNKTVGDALIEIGKKAIEKEQDSSDKVEEEIEVEEKTVNRYDNEGEFFQLLNRESPILRNLITNKIKYFDPAFHSISPEGFNARLTFLHQCTRQGATIEQGDPNAISAYNLAFGRPPVCVLRLGDFYYTKIIITSLDIHYDNPQWDLNPEGIGMMPMFAKITINFKFLGGSDLAGPIARLQNAVSFNYYANTGVYDNRAEKVLYKNDGSGREEKFKGYIYPNPTKN